MRRRTVLLLLLGVLALLLVSSLNIFSANWNSSGATANSNPEGGPNWSRVWLLPLETGRGRANDLLTAELDHQLTDLGLDVEVAPATYEMTAGEEQPIVLEYAVGEWTNRFTVLGRTAVARVVFQTRLFGDLDSSNTMQMHGSFSGIGQYRGLVQSSRVNSDMAEKVVGYFVQQLAEGLKLPRVIANQPEQNGFYWSFSFNFSAGRDKQPSDQSTVEHALVLNDVDYDWQFLRDGQAQRVYIYRTRQRGDELESELLRRLPSDYASEREFLDLDYNGYFRRTLRDGLVSHWSAGDEALFGTSDPLDGSRFNQPAPYAGLQEQTLERYVLVVDPPPDKSEVMIP